MIAPLLLTALALACPATPLRTDAYAHEPTALRHTAWIATANGAFAGHLFYWSTALEREHGDRASIFTAPYWERTSDNPKVLWIARRRIRSSLLSVTGRHLDGPGRFRTVEDAVSGTPPQVPS